MINRKQRNIIWENTIRNKIKGNLTISLFNGQNDSITTPFISKNQVNRLFKNLPSFGGTLSLNSLAISKDKDSCITSGEVRQVRSSKPDILGFVINLDNNQEFISVTEAKELLKEMPESPNYDIQGKGIKKELLLNLICVLSWREVELVSEVMD